MHIFNEQYKNCTDEKLMFLTGQGDNSALEELYSRYSKRLLYYFYRMLGNDEDIAQDFLQDIFLKIIEKVHMFDGKKRFSTWIYNIAHNMCKNEYRRHNVRKNTRNVSEIDSISLDMGIKELTAEEKFDQKKFRDALLIELENINENQKTIFLMRYQEKFSIREISKIVNCSEGTVKSRLFYTTKKLAKKLKEFNSN